MPDFILPAEADHCPYCGAALREPPDCCDAMRAEHRREWNERLGEASDYEYLDVPPNAPRDPEDWP